MKKEFTFTRNEIIDNRQIKDYDFFDVVKCNYCGTVQAVDIIESACHCCGIEGCLMDIEADVHINDDRYILKG